MPEKIITIYILILCHRYDGSSVVQKYVDMLAQL